jgi:hypothetical protein
MIVPDVRQRLQAGGDARREALIVLGEWAKGTCLLVGSKPETAYEVAALFVGGLRRELEGERRQYPFSVR